MLLAACSLLVQGQVVINEFSSSNNGIVMDEDNDSPDWIELYNSSAAAVDLEGWGITDDSLKPFKWTFPSRTLQPGEYLLVFASAKDRKGAMLHTNFKLEKGLEPLLLFEPAGALHAGHPCVCIAEGASYGHYPDGAGTKYLLSSPSPAASNNSSTYQPLQDISDNISFSHAGGFYTSQLMLEMNASQPGSVIRYTMDGSEPAESSTVYSSPLSITDRSNEKGFAYTPTSPDWKEPKGTVKRGTVVRAAAFANGCRVSRIYTHTYLIDPGISERYKFPVVSLSTGSDNFFSDHTGIYVKGHYGAEQANYLQKGEEWERAVHMEYYSPGGDLLFGQDLGVRIHGRGTRQGPQKSLRLYAKNKYEKETMDHKFFDGKDIASFRRIVLKTTNTSGSSTLFKDELCAELVKNMHTDYQAYQPVIVFINGEYWGVHNMRERMDKYYCSDNHPVSADSLDMLGLSLEGNEELEGDANAYNNLLNYVSTHDMSDDHNFSEVKKMIDLDNYIDVHIAQLYLANYDWPRNNVRYWRERSEDGSWRWMFFDCDFCMSDIQYNQLSSYVDGEPRFEESTWLVRHLLKNDKFREQFVQRFMHHLSTTFEPGRVTGIINDFKSRYAPMVSEHIDRWGMPESYAAWENNVNELEYFALKRPLHMVNKLVEMYGNPFMIYPNPASSQVNIVMNGVEEIPLDIKIINMHGQTVMQRSYGSAQGMSSGPVDISSLAHGMYILQLQYGTLVFNDKLVVQ